MVKKILLLLFFVWVISVFSMGTAFSGPPSDSTIKSAIESQYIGERGNTGNGTDVMGNKVRNFNVELLDIKEKGKFHPDKDYLLVRVRVKASRESCLWNPMTNQPQTPWGRDVFDNLIEYKVYKDDFGKWKAEKQSSSNYDSSAENSERAKKLYYSGLNNAKLGKHKEAINDFSECIKLTASFTCYNSRGIIYTKLGNYQEAFADYNKAIELAPNDMRAYSNMAWTYALLNNPIEACRYLKISIDKGNTYWGFIKSDKIFGNIQNSSCYKEIVSGK